MMKYFTPELFLRFNSEDDTIADQANADWEKAVMRYQYHLNTLRNLGNSFQHKGLNEIAELSLHDCEFLPAKKHQNPHNDWAMWSYWQDRYLSHTAIPLQVSLRLISHERVVTLFYLLCAEVRIAATPENWHFSKGKTLWLYDEIDQIDNQDDLITSQYQREFAPELSFTALWPLGFWHRILMSDGRVIAIPFLEVRIFSNPLISQPMPANRD